MLIESIDRDSASLLLASSILTIICTIYFIFNADKILNTVTEGDFSPKINNDFYVR